MIQMELKKSKQKHCKKMNAELQCNKKLIEKWVKFKHCKRQNQRVEEYISAEKSNMAVFSASGVDVECINTSFSRS